MILETNNVVVFDLDDTLYNEVDFLKSAFNSISLKISAQIQGNKTAICNDMLDFYLAKENVFELILKKYQCTYNINQLLNFYRTHKPELFLKQENIEILDYLKQKEMSLGLLTDGRSIQQRSKIKAMNLEGYFTEIIISEEFGSEKPNIKNYKYFEKTFKEGEYFYIGDNLKKDFITPNKLGWTTICLLDNGFNIHSQDFNLSQEYLPKHKINTLKEIKNIIQL
jgi:putative hydrolase of the HAD superfamily